MTARLRHGDCRDVLATLEDNSTDSIVTDPPYELGFMGKGWDRSGIANDPAMWAEALRVLKPGGHLLAFSGSRTYHRMVCAIEDAGLEIRDQIFWVYGSGFPKSRNIGSGWGTALKPAHEPIVVARKPLEGTVAANVAKWGTGALNIDGCRVGTVPRTTHADGNRQRTHPAPMDWGNDTGHITPGASARWPANLIHDGSDEVMDLFAAFGDRPSRDIGVHNQSSMGYHGGGEGRKRQRRFGNETGTAARFFQECPFNEQDISDGGTLGPVPRSEAASPGPGHREQQAIAARFIYCAKASRADRDAGLNDLEPTRAAVVTGRKEGSAGLIGDSTNKGQTGNPYAGTSGEVRRNTHPTVKPTSLMRYLCRLVTPPGGTVLDPFMGSGSTGRGAILEGFRFIGIDITEDYVTIARKRIANAAA